MIWFLLLIGSLLVILNIRAIKKEGNTFNHVYSSELENMKEFEFSIGEVRREFSETILELQKEIEEVKSLVKGLGKEDIFIEEENVKVNYENNENYVYDQDVQNDQSKEYNLDEEYERNEEYEEVDKDDKHEEEYNTGTSNSVKIEEIKELLSQGLAVEEVSKKLGIGKGEVLLIKELYLK